VFNANTMKSVGERIRQAREFRKMSGEELAHKVGYKTQSGISNLENRNGGMGGAKVFLIAKVLDVSLHWLLNGPDTNDMKTVQPFSDTQIATTAHEAREPENAYLNDLQAAHKLLDAMSSEGVKTIIEILRMTAAKYPRHEGGGAGVPIPAPKQRAA
jgi:transcriptional regulator with XRE-family HTH domain